MNNVATPKNKSNKRETPRDLRKKSKRLEEGRNALKKKIRERPRLSKNYVAVWMT